MLLKPLSKQNPFYILEYKKTVSAIYSCILTTHTAFKLEFIDNKNSITKTDLTYSLYLNYRL